MPHSALWVDSNDFDKATAWLKAGGVAFTATRSLPENLEWLPLALELAALAELPAPAGATSPTVLGEAAA